MKLLADRGATDEPQPKIDDAPAAGDDEGSQHRYDNDLGNLRDHSERIGVADHQPRSSAIEDPIDAVIDLEIGCGLGCCAARWKFGDGMMQRLRQGGCLVIEIPGDGSQHRHRSEHSEQRDDHERSTTWHPSAERANERNGNHSDGRRRSHYDEHLCCALHHHDGEERDNDEEG